MTDTPEDRTARTDRKVSFAIFILAFRAGTAERFPSFARNSHSSLPHYIVNLCATLFRRSRLSIPQGVRYALRPRNPDMNPTSRRQSWALAAIACLAASLPACQNGGSHFSPSSQATIVADTVPGTSGQNGLASEGSGMPEGIGHYAGHYYYIRNGSAMRLEQQQHFAQGYYFDRKGRVVAGDGSIVRLNDREMVTFAGERLPTPPNVVFP